MHSLILIADDAPEMASTLDTCLTRNGFRTFQTNISQAVLATQLNLKPDLVILDVRELRADTLDMLARLRRQSDTPIVVISACDLDWERLRALHAGADDYIVRPFNPDVVVARLLTMLRRSGALAPERRLRVGALEVDTESYMACVRTPSGEMPVSVTLVEFRLLAHMARLPNRAFTRVELLNACMADISASTRTVDSHMSRLRRKLAAAGVSGILESVHGVGYRLRKSG
ncbi:DNA-binding response regulator [Burkholderia contaminans]|uniref:response regulator transcription factor n=1 Tax=Burkholderia contaminans TaxID=488447 RepID=UPI000F5AA4F6|nr:response regulator transcription factor [Burkholderia contaminans]RQT05947.1 DNA-binding response regulator [Burkholderia contaminans]HEM7876445.1 response regulator transcription factor [Burkholderia contaminans]